MNIDINTPEITLLRKEVERVSSIEPRLVSDFVILSNKIKDETHETLSQSTLERVWQYSTRRKSNVAEHTLNVLARYVGASDWSSFKDGIKANAHPESDYFTDGILDVQGMSINQLLELAWLPDRKIKIKYLGSQRFEVVESLNSSIRVGDKFECAQIQEGHPLYLDHFLRCGADPDTDKGRYVIGRDSGITSVRVLL